MGLMNSIAKFGIAKKALEEAQKPQNQQKAKDLFAKVSEKAKSRGNKPTTN